jgi:glycosyltransferase involved in cell wall biosynthesis
VRVLIINSMFVNALYRRCADELGRLPGIELTVLTTESWVMNGKLMPLDPVAADAPYRFIAGAARWKGKENRGFYTDGIAQAFRSANPEVIYLMEEPFSIFATQILAVKRMICPDVPVVFFTWNNLSLRQYDYRPSIAYRNLARLNLRSLDHALTANTDGVDVLREFGYERPAQTVGYGVDTERYSEEDKKRVNKLRNSFGIEAGDRVIGYVGRLLHMKGIDLLIESFETLAAEDPTVKLLLIGSGEAEQAISSRIDAARLRHRVVRVPVVPHSAVPDHMHLLEILVLPSRRVGMWAEQFGRVMVEAMAAGKIVVGSTSGAIPEVIGDAGFVFRENDAAHLTATLRQALSLPAQEVQALKDRALYRATVTYGWRNFAQMSYDALESAAASRKERRRA